MIGLTRIDTENYHVADVEVGSDEDKKFARDTVQQ